jgi:acetylornithine deacetylase/succinyl-diaminopimelate desuccinylase family protein
MINSVEILKELIKIRSDNPGSYEEDIALFISKILHKNGIYHELVYSGDHRANIIGYLYGKSKKTLILCGHLDTKPPDRSWTYDPFTPVIKGNKLYGLGSADMKGGIAAILSAIIQNKRKKLNGTICFIFVADEEMNSNFGIKYLVENGYINNGNFAIVAEPTNLKLAVRSLGNIWLKISIKGKKAHAGMYWKGTNAIDIAIEAIQRIKNFVKNTKYQGDTELSMFPSVNIGRIEGGSHPGTIADTCEFTLDIRFKEAEEKSYFEEKLTEIIEETVKQYKCDYKINYFGGGGLSPWDIHRFHREDINTYLQIIEQSYVEVFKKPLKKVTFLGGSDAGVLTSSSKIPTVIIGPGSLEQAHNPDEWVYIDEVIGASMLYDEIIRRWPRWVDRY